MIDLNQHPLSTYFQAVAKEYDRSIIMDNARIGKHRPWQQMTDAEQREAIMDEWVEWDDASVEGDIHGEYGELSEIPQAANCFGKRWMILKQEGE
jgi:hypothetical protein